MSEGLIGSTEVENPSDTITGLVGEIWSLLREFFQFDPVLCIVIVLVLIFLIFVSRRGGHLKLEITGVAEEVALEDDTSRLARFLSLLWKESVLSVADQFQKVTTVSCLSTGALVLVVYLHSQIPIDSAGTGLFVDSLKLLWQILIIVMYGSLTLRYFADIRSRAAQVRSGQFGI